MTFRWPWEPKVCNGCEQKKGQIRVLEWENSGLAGRLHDSEDERKRLLEALITSMAPAKPTWPPASPEQAAAREQRALKVMFEGKDGDEPKVAEKPYPAEFPAIG